MLIQIYYLALPDFPWCDILSSHHTTSSQLTQSSTPIPAPFNTFPSRGPFLPTTQTHSLPSITLCHSSTLPPLLRTSIVYDRSTLSPESTNHLTLSPESTNHLRLHTVLTPAAAKPCLTLAPPLSSHKLGPSSIPPPACILCLLFWHLSSFLSELVTTSCSTHLTGSYLTYHLAQNIHPINEHHCCDVTVCICSLISYEPSSSVQKRLLTEVS